MFKKILVPLDGSGHSLRALEIAVGIAKNFSSRLVLIHVHSAKWLISKPGELAMLPELIEETRKIGNRILADNKKRVEAEGVQVATVLREGHAVGEIVKTCKESKCDLIVMGARGLSTIKEILFGSVSHGVARHAPCPVLVVRQSYQQTSVESVMHDPVYQRKKSRER